MGRNSLAINAFAETRHLFRKHMKTKITDSLLTLAQKVYTAAITPTEKQVRTTLFFAGVSLLVLGLSVDGLAQFTTTNYNDFKIANTRDVVMTYLEGSFGALIMVIAGLVCIIAATIGRYKVALLYLGLAVGGFITRSMIGTFFDDNNIIE
jgi:hypothetical protein